MQTSLTQPIRDHLGSYLAGRTSLDEFGEWFVPATWAIDSSGDQTAIDLTYEVIQRLAEYSNGHCSEAQLKTLLRPLIAATSVNATSSD